MTGRNVNIYFQEETYNKIKGLVSQRKISKFINEAAEEKLAQEQKKIKDNIKKQLIADYQDMSQIGAVLALLLCLSALAATYTFSRLPHTCPFF